MAVFRESKFGSSGDPTITWFVGRHTKKAASVLLKACGCTPKKRCRKCKR
jgi:hypothetical protein